MERLSIWRGDNMVAPYKGKFKVTQAFTLGKHNGLDLVGLDDKTLYAVCDGTIGSSTIITDKANKTWEWGNYVKLIANDGTLIFYCHMSKRLVKKGDKVKKGDPIGIEGNTGYSFGSHCHFEVRNASNKPTASVNTVKFTGIPNEKGTYTHSFAPPTPTRKPGEITSINGARPAGALVLITDGRKTTGFNQYGFDVIFDSNGKVISVISGKANTAIPKGCCCLSGHGINATYLQKYKVGDRVKI